MANNLPANQINLTKNENAVMTIEGLKSTSFFISSFNIPGISTGVIELANPFKQHSEPGSKLQYAELTFDMLIAEDLSNWLEIYEWIKEGNNGYSFSSQDITRRAGNIFITTNNMNAQFQITYKEMFPIALGSINVELQQIEPIPLEAPVTMVYRSFDIRPVT